MVMVIHKSPFSPFVCNRASNDTYVMVAKGGVRGKTCPIRIKGGQVNTTGQ